MYTVVMKEAKIRSALDDAEEWIVERNEIKEEVREEYEELRLSIVELNKNIKDIFSYWKIWLRGIVQGVGIAIGSGIVFVILSALLYQLFTYFGLGPEVKGLLPVKNLPMDKLESKTPSSE